MSQRRQPDFITLFQRINGLSIPKQEELYHQFEGLIEEAHAQARRQSKPFEFSFVMNLCLNTFNIKFKNLERSTRFKQVSVPSGADCQITFKTFHSEYLKFHPSMFRRESFIVYEDFSKKSVEQIRLDHSFLINYFKERINRDLCSLGSVKNLDFFDLKPHNPLNPVSPSNCSYLKCSVVIEFDHIEDFYFIIEKLFNSHSSTSFLSIYTSDQLLSFDRDYHFTLSTIDTMPTITLNFEEMHKLLHYSQRQKTQRQGMGIHLNKGGPHYIFYERVMVRRAQFFQTKNQHQMRAIQERMTAFQQDPKFGNLERKVHQLQTKMNFFQQDPKYVPLLERVAKIQLQKDQRIIELEAKMDQLERKMNPTYRR